MDLSSEGAALVAFIRTHMPESLPEVDVELADFAASLFDAAEPDDDADEVADVVPAKQQVFDMLFASTGEDEHRRDAVALFVDQLESHWAELLALRGAEDDEEEEGAESGELDLDARITQGGAGPHQGEEGGADGAAPMRLRRKDEDDVFNVDESVRAATLAAFYRQADDGEEAAWHEETAAPKAKEGGKDKGKNAGPAGKEAAKQDFGSRMNMFDSFATDLSSEIPLNTLKSGGKSARKKARRMGPGQGRGGEEESSSEEEQHAPPPTVGASRIVSYDPMDMRLDNREYAAFLDRAKRDKAKEDAEAEKQRERDKGEAARAARELARNAPRLPKAAQASVNAKGLV